MSALAPRVLPAALLEGDDFRRRAPARALPPQPSRRRPSGRRASRLSPPTTRTSPNSTISPGSPLTLSTLSTSSAATRYCLPPVLKTANIFCPRVRSRYSEQVRTGFLQSFLLLLEARADRPQQPPATRRGSYGGPPSRCQEMPKPCRFARKKRLRARASRCGGVDGSVRISSSGSAHDCSACACA